MPAKHGTTPAANLALATDYLLEQFGMRVAAMAKREEWHPATGPLVCDYVHSLVEGNGVKPAELATVCAQAVNTIFVEQCSKIIVGHDVLPGQRQDWYKAALAKHRRAQRKAQRKGAEVQAQRRPSPLEFVKKGFVPSQQLQPTG